MSWPSNVLIVAEIGASHCQDYDIACRLIDAAAEAGADAIKLQLYKPESMTLDLDRPEFIIKDGLWVGKRLWDLYETTYLPWEWVPSLKERIEALGRHFVLSVYDEAGLDYAERRCKPWAYKVASFELNDKAFVRRVAATKVRTILSTGLAEPGEVAPIMAMCQQTPAHDLAVLHCVTDYPAGQQMGLARMRTFWACGAICGLSDHSHDAIVVPSMAVAAGARIIEKHITLLIGHGADAPFSLAPGEFRTMVEAVRHAEQIMAPPAPSPYRQFRRAVYAVRDISTGEELDTGNIKTLRAPGPRDDLDALLGQAAPRDYQAGEAIE